MRVNIFKINIDSLKEFKQKLSDVRLSSVFNKDMNGWNAELFFSNNPDEIEVPWLKYFKDDIETEHIRNRMYFGVFIWSNLENCFAVTYGKSHHYAKTFCELGFGLNLATKIADSKDIRQKSARKFGGSNIRSINSYQKETLLDLNVNESVDYLSAKISEDKVKQFSKQAKFADSLQITKDINWLDFGEFLNHIVNCLIETPKFDLPKRNQIKDEKEIEKLNIELKQLLDRNHINVNISEDSYSIIGVDFNFSSTDKYELYFKKGSKNDSQQLDSLDLPAIIKFAKQNEADLFDIKIKFYTDTKSTYSKDFKTIIDYTHPTENIILQDGKWFEFNEEYVNQLNTFVDMIKINTTNEMPEIDKIIESDFSKLLSNQHGYNLYDKTFASTQKHLFEPWDLEKDETVYAVKFGYPQKLSYVFDQAINTLTLLTNKVKTEKGLIYENFKIKKFCIWLCISRKTKLSSLSSVKSLIFKQKAVEWHKICKNLNIDSEIKISYIIE